MYTINHIRSILKTSITVSPEKAAAFFKTQPGAYGNHDIFMGVSVPTLRVIAKNVNTLSFQDLTCLLTSRINEERLLALIMLVQKYKQGDDDGKEAVYQFYLTHLDHINNWNLVDASAHLIVGAHLWDKDRGMLEGLTQSTNLWHRRIGMVATWYFIRKNDLTWTFKIAHLLLQDTHDLIHKAVGWMLREAGKKNEADLLDFLTLYAEKMPRTMVRYAVERLSEEKKQAYKRVRLPSTLT